MLELLAKFSIQQIIIYSVIGALAFKSVVDFFIWLKGLYDKKFNKDYNAKKGEQELQKHFENCKQQSADLINKYEELGQKIDRLAEDFEIRMDQFKSDLKLLKTSDMHDIKGWIVEKHHNLTKQGWVDDFTMDTIEYRYSDYKAEHGNSYVDSLMAELRALPKVSPELKLNK